MDRSEKYIINLSLKGRILREVKISRLFYWAIVSSIPSLARFFCFSRF